MGIGWDILWKMEVGNLLKAVNNLFLLVTLNIAERG